MRRPDVVSFSLLVVALAHMLQTPGAAGTSVPDVYVNNKRVPGFHVGKGTDIYVDLAAACAVLRLAYTLEAGTGKAHVNGHAMESTRLRGASPHPTVLVSLKELAAVTGGRLRIQRELGIVDLITFDPTQRARLVASQASPGAPGARTSRLIDPDGTPSQSDINAIYEVCLRCLRADLGMKVDVPVRKVYETPADIRMKAGQEMVLAYTQPLYYGEKLVDIEMHLPTGSRGDRITHIIAHELGHCWQMEEGVQFGTKILVEGFCEWAASEVLKSQGFTAEVKVIESNMAREYSDGYRFVQNMADRIGPVATVEHFRQNRWDK